MQRQALGNGNVDIPLSLAYLAALDAVNVWSSIA